MRVTKRDLEGKVIGLSELMGEQLYLVECYKYLILSPIKDSSECQRHCYLRMANAYNRENYEKLEAFEAGLRTAIQKMNVR